MRPKRAAALAYYEAARRWILSSDFYAEPLWQTLADYDAASESQLLREHAWVVLNSGFKESVIRARFDYISLCFCDWESAEAIVGAGAACVTSAMSAFRNERKLNAILAASHQIRDCGFSTFSAKMKSEPLTTLMSLPYIGGVTALHLAKNLGLNVVKPDRHLVRLASRFCFESVQEMCEALAQETGDQESIVDLVLWRFQEQSPVGALRSA